MPKDQFIEAVEVFGEIAADLMTVFAKASGNPDFLDDSATLAKEIMGFLATKENLLAIAAIGALLTASHSTLAHAEIEYMSLLKDSASKYPCLTREVKHGRLHVDRTGEVHTKECDLFAKSQEAAEAKLIAELPTC